MLSKIAFAHAFAVVSGVFYVVFFLIAFTAPAFFELVFNAQFFGADVTSLLPTEFSFDIGALIILVITSWLAGYLLAWTYNKFRK